MVLAEKYGNADCTECANLSAKCDHGCEGFVQKKPVVRIRRVVRVHFLPYLVPEYADSDGWLTREFESEDAAYAWAEENTGLIEDAEFALTGFKFVSSGSIERED